MKSRGRYRLSLREHHGDEAKFTSDWQIATIKARNGDTGDLARMLRTVRPVPDQTIEVVANMLEVMATRETKPLYSEEDYRLIGAAVEYGDSGSPVRLVVNELAEKWNVPVSKLERLLTKKSTLWQRLRHVFRLT